MIFIVKDEHSISKDTTLAKHVVGVHMSATRQNTSDAIDVMMSTEEDPNETIGPDFLRSYIAYCRA